MAGNSSSILMRRRHSEPRRRSGVGLKLGAVKMTGGSDSGSDAVPSPSHSVASSAGVVTPQDRSPLVTRTTSGPTPPTARPTPPSARGSQQHQSQAALHQQLVQAHSADAWLDSQLAPPTDMAARQQHAHRSPVLGNVESAASQIVHKAMQYLTVNERSSAPKPALKSPLLKFDSNSLLDKGLDAITGVGKIMEGFALTLDSVIGQAFEDWGQPKTDSNQPVRDKQPTSNARPLHPRQPAAAAAQPPASAGAGAQDGGFVAAGTTSSQPQKENAPQRKAGAGGRQTQVTTFMSRISAASEGEVQEWRRRAQQLAQELQKIKEQQEEYQRIKEAYERLQVDAKQQVAQVQAGKSATTLHAVGPADDCLADPLAAQQVTHQMEALLVEKAKLAQENARLLRENTGLQELLEFTMLQQAEYAGDDELFEDEYPLAAPDVDAMPADTAISSGLQKLALNEGNAPTASSGMAEGAAMVVPAATAG